MTAAERDEILAMRDKSDAELESARAKVEELQFDLAEAHSQLTDLSLECETIDQASKQAAKVTAGNELAVRSKLEALVAENAQLRDTTVASERDRAEEPLLELKK